MWQRIIEIVSTPESAFPVLGTILAIVGIFLIILAVLELELGPKLSSLIKRVNVRKKIKTTLATIGVLFLAAGLLACFISLRSNRHVGPGPSVDPNRPTEPTKVKEKLVHRGAGLEVILTDKEVVIKNVYYDTVAIRISWDKKDKDGTGAGEDSFAYGAVRPDKTVSAELGNHSSVQVWAWDKHNKKIDYCTSEIYDHP